MGVPPGWGAGTVENGLTMKTAAYAGDADTHEILLKSARPLASVGFYYDCGSHGVAHI